MLFRKKASKNKLLKKLLASKKQKQSNRLAIEIDINSEELKRSNKYNKLVIVKNVSTNTLHLLDCKENMEDRWSWETIYTGEEIQENFNDERIIAKKWPLPFSPF